MVSNIYSTHNLYKQCHAELYITHALEGREGDTTVTVKPEAGLLGLLHYIELYTIVIMISQVLDW